MKIWTLYKHKMGCGIQHRHRNQTSGAGEERGNEKHSSSKGMWVWSCSHCHPQTAIMFVFKGFLETYFNLPLNVPLSLQAYMKWGPWFTFIKRNTKGVGTSPNCLVILCLHISPHLLISLSITLKRLWVKWCNLLISLLTSVATFGSGWTEIY